MFLSFLNYVSNDSLLYITSNIYFDKKHKRIKGIHFIDVSSKRNERESEKERGRARKKNTVNYDVKHKNESRTIQVTSVRGEVQKKGLATPGRPPFISKHKVINSSNRLFVLRWMQGSGHEKSF